MRIAVYHNLSSGGAKRALYGYVRELAARDVEVDIFTVLGGEEYLPLQPFARQHRIYPFHAPRRVLGSVRFPGRHLAESTLLQPSYRSLARTISRDIDDGRYDLCFVHHCRHMQSAFVLRYLATPSLYYCQEPYRDLYEAPIPEAEFASNGQGDSRVRLSEQYSRAALAVEEAGLRRADRANAQSASMILAGSHFSAESILRAYGRRAHLSPMGIDPTRFTPTTAGAERERLVVSVGRLHPRKGYGFIIDSLALIPADRRPRFLIVADMASPEGQAALQRRAATQAVELSIETLVTDERLNEALNQASIFVYAPYLEPFGLAPLEAMACGTPVVAVAEGGIRETILTGEVGVLTERDERSFAGCVDSLLQDDSTRARMGAKAVDYVRCAWTWERAVNKLLEHMNRVVSEPTRGYSP